MRVGQQWDVDKGECYHSDADAAPATPLSGGVAPFMPALYYGHTMLGAHWPPRAWEVGTTNVPRWNVMTIMRHPVERLLSLWK